MDEKDIEKKLKDHDDQFKLINQLMTLQAKGSLDNSKSIEHLSKSIDRLINNEGKTLDILDRYKARITKLESEVKTINQKLK